MNPPNPNNDAYNRQVFNDSYRAHEKFVRQWGEPLPTHTLSSSSNFPPLSPTNWQERCAHPSPQTETKEGANQL